MVLAWRRFGLGLCFGLSAAAGAASVCFGTPSQGRLSGGVALPERGTNFQPYSAWGGAAGRTHVHERVAQVVRASYAHLAVTQPDVTFVYGETGWPHGGPFPPHRTHQNGLAVDFMVPVRDAQGRSVPLPADPGNRFGYDLEFDAQGRSQGLTIDFDAIAAHLLALQDAARQHGVVMARVIFDPALQPRLFQSRLFQTKARRSIRFMSGQAWVRHDEHYHVDFSLPCRPYAPRS